MATKSVATKTIENVFQICRYYGWVLWGSSNIEITREVFRIDNPYPNEFKSFVDCMANFKKVEGKVRMYAFLEFVINAVNQLEENEKQLLFERYFWQERYKSDAAHAKALEIAMYRYKKQMNMCRQRMSELLGLGGITLKLPKGAEDW